MILQLLTIIAEVLFVFTVNSSVWNFQSLLCMKQRRKLNMNKNILV